MNTDPRLIVNEDALDYLTTAYEFACAASHLMVSQDFGQKVDGVQKMIDDLNEKIRENAFLFIYALTDNDDQLDDLMEYPEAER